MIRDFHWLYCMWRVYQLCKGAYFSKRINFLDELRPIIAGSRINYPFAFLLITKEDVDRAEQTLNPK
jgi:hypothetical protein